VRLDTFAGTLCLKGFFRLCARIDACMSAAAVDALSRELEPAHHASPYGRTPAGGSPTAST
jgi:hypothetical protein